MNPYLSAVATSEENDHGSGGDGLAQLPLVLAEGLNPVALQFAGHILCWVVAGLGFKQIKLTIRKTWETTLGNIANHLLFGYPVH